MKNILLLVINLFLASISFAQVGIGTTTPNASAILDLQSDSSGMLIPRLTSTNRMDISSPANGLMVYDITTESFWGFADGEWKEFLSNSDPSPYFEVGTTFAQALNGGGGLYANIHYFDQPFDTTPVVINTMDVSLFDLGAAWAWWENQPSANRIDFRTSNSVDALNIFAIPPGEHTISGKKIVAGRAENLGSGLNTIALPDVFNEFPIIIISAEVPSNGNSAATGLRILEVDSSEFEIWSNAITNVNWIAMDPGEYEYNGWKWYVGEANLNTAELYHSISYPQTFDTKHQRPIVFTSLYDWNNNGPTWSRLNEITDTDFEIRVGNIGLEALHWVAFVKM